MEPEVEHAMTRTARRTCLGLCALLALDACGQTITTQVPADAGASDTATVTDAIPESPPPDQGASDQATSVTDAAVTAPVVDCTRFVLTGDPGAMGGANWTYTSTDAGVAYNMEGVLFVPAGPGPFPGVVVSHGAGGVPAAYSATIARTMVTWGLAAIGPRYTHAADIDGHNAMLLPAGPNGASEANVQRAHKARDLLSCVNGVDLSRIAAHGHSMGAFVTGQLIGTMGGDFRAASHTAGGTAMGPNATQAAAAAMIRTPYQIHHGEADTTVPIVEDETLDKVLTDNGVVHEFHRYPGYTHEAMSTDATMLDRVRAWYQGHGVLP
jgi:dienelactone hydrolase